MKQLVFIIIITIATVFKTWSCTCPIQLDTKEDFEHEWNRVEFVMEVKIIDILEKPEKNQIFGTMILKAKVLQIHKGAFETKTINIYTEIDGGASCQYYFELGKSYLFYGHQDKQNYYYTSNCLRTNELSKSKFDLKMIKKRQN